jgi:hypothetical protein
MEAKVPKLMRRLLAAGETKKPVAVTAVKAGSMNENRWVSLVGS